MTSPLMAILSSLRTGGRPTAPQGNPDRLQMLAQAKMAQRGGGGVPPAPGGMPGPGGPPMGGAPQMPPGMGAPGAGGPPMGMPPGLAGMRRPGPGYGRPRVPSVMGRE